MEIIMTSSKEFFIDTKPSRLFFKASVPGAVGMIASNIYFSLEMLLIGRLIGQSAFAAGNLALPLILINFALADMIAVGSSVRIAIRLGEGRNDDANKVFTTAVFIAVILSALTSFVSRHPQCADEFRSDSGGSSAFFTDGCE